MTPRLGVNIDHVATVRQARMGHEPDPVWAAVEAQLGGADGITIHLREDRRHIQERDLRLLRQMVSSRLNLEMALDDEILTIACEVKPDEATLVPEKRQELTTEGGLDVAANEPAIERAVKILKEHGIHVSIFIDPDIRQIEIAKLVGAEAVEIQTARYSEAKSPTEQKNELDEIAQAGRFAHEHGLHVHAGHGLNYINTRPIAALPEIQELNIGHSIVSRAIFTGMRQAVREMKDLIASARGP